MIEITLMDINFRDGGYDRMTRSFQRLDLLAGLAAALPFPPDVVFLQEGYRFGDDGAELMHYAGQLLGGLTGFLMPPVHGLLYQVVYLRCPPFVPLRHFHRHSPGVYHDQEGWVHAGHPALGERVLKLCSVHMAYHDGDARMSEAKRYSRYAASGEFSVLAGDFNSLWPDCPRHDELEPDWTALPDHARGHKTLGPGDRAAGEWVSDRRAGTVLAEAGWVNVGCLAGDMRPTVQPEVDNGQGARIDHILVSRGLAPAVVASSYDVDDSSIGARASDHKRVSVRLNLAALAPSLDRAPTPPVGGG
ncbi:endonuclease/exonuclease/phosphatase family protein [Nonomuraea sp. SYSU D8015]|uniref:endonuclease/exonuclease/phosphatase family protein n=1 Tax=Nonomuraea sp. SYSU D8015 TaxID=2593644 RepID=UPI00166090A6|nr:endonuclease/exonuclease/phosphatase family protein [Nonomuraea sp. SYSU D8015]